VISSVVNWEICSPPVSVAYMFVNSSVLIVFVGFCTFSTVKTRVESSARVPPLKVRVAVSTCPLLTQLTERRFVSGEQFGELGRVMVEGKVRVILSVS